MTVEENRKKVRRNNLLMSMLFLVMIAGVGGAFYFYRNLKIAKSNLLEKKKEVDSLNKRLEDQNFRLQKASDFVDSITRIKIKIDSALLSQNPDNEIYRIQNNLNNKLLPLISSRDSARQHARNGYDKLNNNDFKGAMQEFEKSEKFYKGYHESEEIHQLLKKNEDKLGDKAVQQQIIDKIKKDYNSLQRLEQRRIQ
jgi:flagellar basal body-associated protein FliL